MSTLLVPRKKMTASQWVQKLSWRHLIALAAIAFALFPLVWMTSAAFDTLGDVSAQQLIPAHRGLDNFRHLFQNPESPYWRWMGNSLIVASVTAVMQIIIGSSAAYALSRFRFKGRKTTLLAILVIQMFPQLLATTAIFVIISQLGKSISFFALGNLPALILVFSGGALGINAWMLKGFFDTIPMEIDESAKVDGATHSQIFFKIILPLARPSLAVITILSFIGTMNEYLMSSVILGSNQKSTTLALGMQGFISNQFEKNWGPFAAGALIASVPITILFLFLQKYVVTGLTAGSTKG